MCTSHAARFVLNCPSEVYVGIRSLKDVCPAGASRDGGCAHSLLVSGDCLESILVSHGDGMMSCHERLEPYGRFVVGAYGRSVLSLLCAQPVFEAVDCDCTDGAISISGRASGGPLRW